MFLWGLLLAAPAVALQATSWLKLDGPYLGLSQLLLQRSIQTQVMYFTDFHDELRSEWLSEWGDPCAPLCTVRLSNRESIPKFHGLDAMTDWHAVNYLPSLMRGEPVEYTVRYKVGTGMTSDAYEVEDRDLSKKAQNMWGDTMNQGYASRRRNPFLKTSERYIEYNETIVPERMAQLVMQTREQIANEWSYDLRLLSTVEHDNDYERLTRNAPVNFGTTFEDDVSSPLRGANLDLCDRLATRHAAYDLLDDFYDERNKAGAQELADHLKLDTDDYRSSEDEDIQSAVCRITKIDALAGHARKRGLALRWLDSIPLHLRSAIQQRKDPLVQHWADIISAAVKDEHFALRRTKLQEDTTRASSR